MNTKEPYEPQGFRFQDVNQGEMILIQEKGSFEGWLCYRNADDQWVSLRKATDQDIQTLQAVRLHDRTYDLGIDPQFGECVVLDQALKDKQEFHDFSHGVWKDITQGDISPEDELKQLRQCIKSLCAMAGCTDRELAGWITSARQLLEQAEGICHPGHDLLGLGQRIRDFLTVYKRS